jgi:hypothetical protein
MKVWILCYNYDYEGGSNVAAFSTKEKAEAALAEVKAKTYRSAEYYIDEFDVDGRSDLEKEFDKNPVDS